MSSRRRSDLGAELGVDSVRREALEKPAVEGEHSDGGVPGADHLRRYLDNSLKHPFKGHFGDQRRSGYHQPLQLRAGRARPRD